MKFKLLLASFCAMLALSACGDTGSEVKKKDTVTTEQGTTSDTQSELVEKEAEQDSDIKRFTLGETLTVSQDGVDLYEITFDKAFLTDERNQYSEKVADNVVVLEYTYKNLNQEDGTYIIGGMDYKVYDSTGKSLETYPAGVTLYGDTVSIGRTSTAQDAFGFNGDANQVLEIEIYDSVFSAKPLAIVEVQPQ
ncbi:hypothetical protein GMB80_13815 [Turicibacter sanguinis]|nr:hypothetical protein [Turicibacter sanguinis]